VLHELGHVLNGYIDYLRSEGILAWDETSNIPTALSDLEQAQVLEYDADFFGWNNLINWLFTIYTTSGKVADKYQLANSLCYYPNFTVWEEPTHHY